jgi:hypothetical protein
MGAHVGADAETGPVHRVYCTTGNVANITMMGQCLHGQERGYHKSNRTIEKSAPEEG